MLWLLWMFLSYTPNALKSPIYAVILPSQDVLEEILSTSLIVFAPGLVEALQAATPPIIGFFETLPTAIEKEWAVYLLVLEKPEFRPRVYIGSGTRAIRGVIYRHNQYENKVLLPRFMDESFNQGYTIVHKGLLCWSPIPLAEHRLEVRTVFKALEALFSIVLWAMYSRTTDYAMPHFCPWALDTMAYDGLCSHVAIYEDIPGLKDGLSPKELAARQVELDARRAEQNKRYKQKAWLAIKASSDYETWKAEKYAKAKTRDA